MRASYVLDKEIAFNHKVNKLVLNSKEAGKNDIFFAMKGSKTDGNLYIEEAIKNGAKTIVTENNITIYDDINVIIVDDIYKYLANCAKRFYKDISKKVRLIGITGTNGKTSTATLIYKYLRFIGEKASLISTGKIIINDKEISNKNTTPNIITIYNVLKTSIKEKCKYVIMEVSSHSVKQNRISGLTFEIGGITNITHDHLDFHKSFEDYKFSKMLFLSKVKFPILSNSLVSYFPYFNNVITYGEKFNNEKIDFEIKNIWEKVNGIEFDLKNKDKVKHFSASLLARFNVYNITLFIIVINLLSLYNDDTIDSFFKSKQNVEGRLEVVSDNPTVIVDFAHTPDAVNKVLSFVKKVSVKGKVITVIGMGGNRDKSKREVVGKIVTDSSDLVVFTEDNSREEDVVNIISDMIKGVKRENYEIIYNRYEAIKYAINKASSDDVICVLGKGSEEYIEKNNTLLPFKDKDIILNLLFNKLTS